MHRSDITHPRGTPEYVSEHARYQRSRGRKPSEPFRHLHNPREALATCRNLLAGRCGCGGNLEPHIGCLRYYDDPYYYQDVAEEAMRWWGGLGFGQGVFEGADQSIMSMHLQFWGLTPERSGEAICRPPASGHHYQNTLQDA